jgi:hypothetical protein
MVQVAMSQITTELLFGLSVAALFSHFLSLASWVGRSSSSPLIPSCRFIVVMCTTYVESSFSTF